MRRLDDRDFLRRPKYRRRPACPCVFFGAIASTICTGSASRRRTRESDARSGNRAADVFRRVRDIIKKGPQRRESFDINDAVLEVIALTRAEAGKNGTRIRTELDEKLPQPQGDRVRIQQVAFPFQLDALGAGKVDAAILIPPFSADAASDPTLKPLFSLGEAFGPLETSIWAGKRDFIEKNRAALVDFLEDNQRMRRWMLDPKTRPDAIRLLSDVSKVPVERYADWVYSEKDYYYDPKAMVDVRRLQKNVDDMKRAGIVPAAIDVAPYVDQSLAEEAAARIGR